MAKLMYMYEQFIYHTQIILRLNTLFLSTKKRAYQSFFEFLHGLFPLASLWHAW